MTYSSSSENDNGGKSDSVVQQVETARNAEEQSDDLNAAGNASPVEPEEEEAEEAVNEKAARKIEPSSYYVTEEWSQGTSIHGMVYMFDREHFNAWKQLGWTVLVLTSTGMLLWQIQILYSQYRKFDTNTGLTEIVPRYLSFPEVTICNYDTYQASRVNQSGVNVSELGVPIPKNVEELYAVSQPLEEFIISSQFNTKNLNVTEVWKSVVTSVGICFRFNTDEEVFRTGVSGGLKVDVFLQSNDYAGNTGGVGAIVWVASPGTTEVNQVPFDLVPPAKVQFLGLSRTVYERETAHPWSTCAVGAAPNYTRPKCRANCDAAAIRKMCACRELDDDSSNLSLPFCENYDQCYNEVLSKDLDHLECYDSCAKPPCNETEYIVKSSHLDLAPFRNSSYTPEQLSDTATIFVNYDTISETQVRETKGTTFSDFLSNIGGQMGLFLGISVISIIELFGELLGLRLLPRLWGDRRLHGVGSNG